jgi:hypothetical protein
MVIGTTFPIVGRVVDPPDPIGNILFVVFEFIIILGTEADTVLEFVEGVWIIQAQYQLLCLVL